MGTSAAKDVSKCIYLLYRLNIFIYKSIYCIFFMKTQWIKWLNFIKATTRLPYGMMRCTLSLLNLCMQML